MEGSSRPPPPYPEMEFMNSMRFPGPTNGAPDIMNMFNFIDAIDPSAEHVNNGGAVPNVTSEQRMYAAEYCRLQDIIDKLVKEKEELLKAREPRVVTISSPADKAIILELKRNENTLQLKLNEEKIQFEQMKSQFQVQNVKMLEQEEAVKKYKSELDEAKNTILEREQEIIEYRSVVATQKVLLGKNEEKISELGRTIDKLEGEKGNLQQKLGRKDEVISSLQDKLSDSGENLQTKQNEVEELKQSLENDKKCREDAEASFMKLQNSFSNFNLEFSGFIDELKTVTNFGGAGAEPLSLELNTTTTTTTISLQNKLAMLASHVKNKFQFLQISQTKGKEELTRIKEVVCSLKLMLDSQKPVNEAQLCQSTQTELSESEPPIPIPINVYEPSSAVEATSRVVPGKPSYSSVVQSAVNSEGEVQVPQSISPPDNFEFPAVITSSLSLMGLEANIGSIPGTKTVANGMARGSRKIHGVDSSKSHRGLFCLCGKECLTPKTLKVHIKYFTREWKFKCELCNRRFFNLVYLNRHMVSHGGKNPYKKGWSGCADCGQKFPSRIKLHQHKKTVHCSAVQSSRKTIIKRTLSKLMSQPQSMKKSVSDEDKVNTSTNEVPKISLKKVQTRSQSSLRNVVSNENGNSSSMLWESFDEDDVTEQEKNDDNTTKTNKPSTSKSVADNPRHGEDNSREGPGHFCFCGYHHPFDKRRLLYHIQYFTADPKFTCQLCGQRFIGSNYLRRHCQRVHKIICADSTGCWKCGEQFENRKLLIKHQKLAHGRLCRSGKAGSRNNITAQHKAIPALAPTSQNSKAPTPSADKISNETSVKLVKTKDTVKKSTRQFKIIIKHYKLSCKGNSLPILCVCGYKAKNEECFRKHVKYFAKKCHFVCDICDKGFKTTSNLRSHMQSAHQIVYNLKGCRLCGKVFETLEKLRYHQSIKHTNGTEEDVTNNASSALTSHINPKRSALRSSSCENRAGTSSGPTSSSQPPRNSILTKTTTTTASIITLRRKHGVDLSKRNLGYYCICGTKGSDRKALNNHIHYFTGERKFQCKHCSLKFLHLARLKAHTKRTHKITNIEELGTLGCSDCGLIFHSRLELFQHRKIHSSIQDTPDSSPITDVPQEPVIDSLNSPKDDHNDDAISSVNVTTATTPDPSPLPQNNARATPRVINPQSQAHPQSKRPSTASSAFSVHKPLRIGKNLSVFYCMCGTQFQTDSMLQRHIIDEGVRSAEERSFVQSAQVWTPPSPLNLNAAVEATTARRKNDENVNVAAELEPSPLIPPVSYSTPSSSTSTENNAIRLDKSGPLTHAIDKSKKNYGQGLFCLCGLGFQSTVNMNQHFRFHQNGRKFSCEQCERKFREMNVLNRHMKAKHGTDMARRSEFGCRFCGQVYSTRGELSKHLTKIFTPARKLANCFCPSRMLESTNAGVGDGPVVQQTSLDTTSMEGYEVSLDSLITNTGAPDLPSISIRTSGIETEAENDQQRNFQEPHLVPPEYPNQPTHGVDASKSDLGFICFCGQQCSNKATLNKHIKRFTAERKFICKTCGKGFLAPSLLRRHMLGVHKVVSSGSIGCHKCGELFPTNMELYHHFRIVHNYGCAWEPREMKYTPIGPSLSQDFSQEEPILFQTDATASTNKDERIAAPVHTALPVDPLAESKVYQCSCEKTFFTRKGLNSHVQVKTFGKIFQCSWCSYRCVSHGTLKSHVRKAHKMDYQNLKYACGICAQTFATLEDVTKHRRTTHENWTKKFGKSSSENQAMEQ